MTSQLAIALLADLRAILLSVDVDEARKLYGPASAAYRDALADLDVPADQIERVYLATIGGTELADAIQQADRR